ncbi:MAG: DNA repair and recombination protein RadB [Methanobacteriaceae archaeon]|nr:DNA repair and recombination protein RadB [Methanobacteriaceae archaeon]
MKTLADITRSIIIPTNTPLDSLLGGGIEKGCITQFYGPPGSGKTNISLQILYESVKHGKKAIYIDTEGGLSLDRVQQIAGLDFKNIASNIYIEEPRTFEQQEAIIIKIEELLKKEKIELIIIDSIVALYRLEDEDPVQVNRRLSQQMAKLLTFSRDYDVAVVITNQIYSLFDDGNDNIEPIGGNILKYWSKVIIEIEKISDDPIRNAILKRHKNKSNNQQVSFQISDEGII